jgi:hypothetical protein
VADVEVIKQVNELINAQSDQLWEITISLIVAEIFMIAHLSTLRVLTMDHKIVRGALILAVICNALSLAFGYFSKGALIERMIRLANGHEWTFPELAGTFNFLQVLAVTVGLVVFVVCFYFYSRVLAGALTAGEQREA